jgi:cell division protein FtsW (lipid II flippase)
MIDSKLLAFTILLLIAGISQIAASSIGIQCMNKNSGYKDDHPNNSSFLISQLVTAILITIVAIGGIYLAVTGVDIK